jgi:hypothetical protein
MKENDSVPVFLNKSIKVFKIYSGLFLFAIVVSVIGKPFFKQYSEILDLFVGLPILPSFIMAPIGIYYNLKSSKLNEGYSKKRFRYFIGHLIFCILILIFISVIINDLSKLT